MPSPAHFELTLRFTACHQETMHPFVWALQAARLSLRCCCGELTEAGIPQCFQCKYSGDHSVPDTVKLLHLAGSSDGQWVRERSRWGFSCCLKNETDVMLMYIWRSNFVFFCFFSWLGGWCVTLESLRVFDYCCSFKLYCSFKSSQFFSSGVWAILYSQDISVWRAAVLLC